MPKRYALIGVAGFVAPRHLRAIKDTSGNLLAAVDRFDSVGLLDSYFPDTQFFVEFERFDRHIDKLRRRGEGIDYISICSPNYLHDAHIRFSLRSGCSAICEKPIVLNPWNIPPLQDIERETGQRTYAILQSRLHPAIAALKERYAAPSETKVDVELTYITSRGSWYDYSWKGDDGKSGGLPTNIGVHFFDALIWIFGRVQWSVVHLLEPRRASGFLELERARVRWFLSIRPSDLPEVASGSSFRSITVANEKVEFSDGFTDLHTSSYRAILDGQGFGLDDALPSIDLVSSIRRAAPVGPKSDSHPFVRESKSKA